MLIILIGAFIINMQHYAGVDEEVILEGRLPVYVPMLFAFVVSWFQAGYILVIKTIAQRVNISDFYLLLLLGIVIILLDNRADILEYP